MSEDNRKWYKKKRFLIPIISIALFVILIIVFGIIGIIGLSQISDEEWDNIIEESMDEAMDDTELEPDDSTIDNEGEELEENEISEGIIESKEMYLKAFYKMESPVMETLIDYNNKLVVNNIIYNKLDAFNRIY